MDEINKFEEERKDYKAKIQRLEKKIEILENELEHCRLKAEELRIILLSDFSFKLRSPLNLVVGFCNLLANENLPPLKRTEYIDRIMTGSDELLNLFERLANVTDFR